MFGLGIVAVSGLDVLVPGDLPADLGGLLVGLIFTVAGFSVAGGHRRPLLAVPILLALSAPVLVAATFTAAGPAVIIGAALVLLLAFALWRMLTRRGGMILFPDDLS